MIKGIIFDMDGVVIDSLPAHFKNWRLYLKEKHNFDLTWEFFSKEFNGRAAKDILDLLVLRFGLKESALSLENGLRRKRSLPVLKKEVKLMSGFDKLFNEAKKLNLSTGLATSGTERDVRLVLGPLFPLTNFSSVLTAEDVSRSKPDPEIYRRSIENLRLKPAECLVVEDAFVGIDAAKSAGAFVLAITTSQSAAELKNADFLFPNLETINLGEVINKIKM